MERKVILKWLSIFSVSFFILSIVELLNLIIFSTVISMDLDGQQFAIFNVIFQSGFMSIHAPLLWIFLLCVICAFIALVLSIYRVAKKKIIENFNLAKFMLLIGLFLVIGGFIKMSFIVLLGNNTISTGSTTGLTGTFNQTAGLVFNGCSLFKMRRPLKNNSNLRKSLIFSIFFCNTIKSEKKKGL